MANINPNNTYQVAGGRTITSPTASAVTKKTVAPVVAAPVTAPTQYAGGKAPDDPSNKYNTATGQLNPNYKAPAATGPNLDAISATLAGISGQIPGLTSQVNDFINGKQDETAKVASSISDPGVRTSAQTLNELMTEMNTSIKSNITATDPAAPNFEQSYNDLTIQYGTADLEKQVADLDTQEANLRAQWDATKTSEKGKPVAMNVISGRLSQEQQTMQDQLNAISLQKTTLNNQLTTKYNAISNVMNLKKLDYQSAVDDYDKQFSQQMQMATMARGVMSDENSQEQQLQDNARANANIIYNAITSGADDPTTWTQDQTTQMTKLEVQAGIPVGTYATLVSKNPKSDIVGTYNFVNSANQEVVSMLMRDPKTGEIKPVNTVLGTAKAAAASTTATTAAAKAEQTTIDKFNTDLGNIKLYNNDNEADGDYKTREAFIKYLTMKYPGIDSTDIASAVYRYYLNK